MRITLSLSNVTAQTILGQIKALDRHALMAWGAKDYMSTTTGFQFNGKFESGAGVMFTVRGSNFKGKIAIVYNSLDTYDIFAFVIRKLEVKVKDVRRNVMVEDLVTTLDDLIG